jgi:hypothetical protein
MLQLGVAKELGMSLTQLKHTVTPEELLNLERLFSNS